jgi:hypothetical protein
VRVPTPVAGLVAADGLLRTTPTSLLALSRRLTGSALTNARRSLEEIADAVQDRGHLLERLDQALDSGDLLRLSPAVCLELLASRSTGRLAYIARAGVPDIVPVNYLVHEGTVVIRTAPGPKLQAAERRERVAFEVDDIDETTRTGWSVVVSGVAERLSGQQAAQYAQPEPWANGPRRHTLIIRPLHLDGRQLL